MKALKMSVLATLAIALVAGDLQAQRKKRGGGDRAQGRQGGRQRGGPGGDRSRGFRPPSNPIVTALDKNKDGTISADEINNAAKALLALDKNKDGKLTRDELSPFGGRGGDRGRGGQPGGRGRAGGPGGPGGAEFVDRMFKERDKNKDGKLDKAELGERGARMIERADTNKDGAVSKEELKKMFASFRGRGGRGNSGGRSGRGNKRPKRPGME